MLYATPGLGSLELATDRDFLDLERSLFDDTAFKTTRSCASASSSSADKSAAFFFKRAIFAASRTEELEELSVPSCSEALSLEGEPGKDEHFLLTAGTAGIAGQGGQGAGPGVLSLEIVTPSEDGVYQVPGGE